MKPASVSPLSNTRARVQSFSVILNVRYFDKNSAKCGIKYIKSILNTAILYYICYCSTLDDQPAGFYFVFCSFTENSISIKIEKN